MDRFWTVLCTAVKNPNRKKVATCIYLHFCNKLKIWALVLGSLKRVFSKFTFFWAKLTLPPMLFGFSKNITRRSPNTKLKSGVDHKICKIFQNLKISVQGVKQPFFHILDKYSYPSWNPLGTKLLLGWPNQVPPLLLATAWWQHSFQGFSQKLIGNSFGSLEPILVGLCSICPSKYPVSDQTNRTV